MTEILSQGWEVALANVVPVLVVAGLGALVFLARKAVPALKELAEKTPTKLDDDYLVPLAEAVANAIAQRVTVDTDGGAK